MISYVKKKHSVEYTTSYQTKVLRTANNLITRKKKDKEVQ